MSGHGIASRRAVAGPSAAWFGLLRGAACLLALAGGTPSLRAGDAGPDWAALGHYRAANAAVGVPAAGEHRVVFLGDSITEFWDTGAANVFAHPGFINRGISGQTTPQMLVRLRADVIALQPEAMVLLAGTNDIAGNTGPVSLPEVEGHIASMVELAQAHGIRVVLCAVLPAARYPWAPAVQPVEPIRELNRWLQAYAAQRRAGWVDTFTPMADAHGGMKAALSDDGVHPNGAGYAVLRPLVEQAVAAVLAH